MIVILRTQRWHYSCCVEMMRIYRLCMYWSQIYRVNNHWLIPCNKPQDKAATHNHNNITETWSGQRTISTLQKPELNHFRHSAPSLCVELFNCGVAVEEEEMMRAAYVSTEHGQVHHPLHHQNFTLEGVANKYSWYGGVLEREGGGGRWSLNSAINKISLKRLLILLLQRLGFSVYLWSNLAAVEG